MIWSKNRAQFSHSSIQEWLMTACPSHRERERKKKAFFPVRNCMSIFPQCEEQPYSMLCSSCTSRDMRRPQGIRLLTTYLTPAVYSQSMAEWIITDINRSSFKQPIGDAMTFISHRLVCLTTRAHSHCIFAACFDCCIQTPRRLQNTSPSREVLCSEHCVGCTI